VCSVGDSRLSILRGGRTTFQTTDTVFGFNFPLQLGSRGRALPADGSYDVVEVRPGDVVLLGTDGLWDNVWRDAIEMHIRQIARPARGAAEVARGIADRLAEIAHANGKDPAFFSPFAREAARAGLRHAGGKLDDVTVVASVVVDDAPERKRSGKL
jgi:protein phosphatase PTC7